MKKLIYLLVVIALLGIAYRSFAIIPSSAPQVVGYTDADIDTLLDTKANTSIVGTSLNADDLELNGAVLQTAAEIPHTDTAQTWTGLQTLALQRLTAKTAEPTDEAVMDIIRADNDTWDPSDVPGTDDYFVVCTAAGSPGTYRAFLRADGTVLLSSIELPSYTHWATADAKYNDTSTPHVLTVEECKGGTITNCGASEDRVYTCPAIEFGMNFMVQTCITAVSRQMDLEPDSGETFNYNGTQMAQDEHIINAADTKGDVMSCWSVESGDGTYELFCKSDNTNWAEATP